MVSVVWCLRCARSRLQSLSILRKNPQVVKTRRRAVFRISWSFSNLEIWFCGVRTQAFLALAGFSWFFLPANVGRFPGAAEITISGPILVVVDGFYFWRRRSRLKREIIDDNIRQYYSCMSFIFSKYRMA